MDPGAQRIPSGFRVPIAQRSKTPQRLRYLAQPQGAGRAQLLHVFGWLHLLQLLHVFGWLHLLQLLHVFG